MIKCLKHWISCGFQAFLYDQVSRIQVEVNNLELDPEYYIPEFRVALCLNCSVHFKSLRANRYKRQIYFKNIQNAVIQNQGNITIQVDTNTTITFTDTHLAEIQEILKHMPG